jgi:uncharacterized protein (DUF1778 family)
MTSLSPNTRLDFRIRQEQKSLIERAADLEGRTLTDFAIAALMDAAQAAIERATLTTLSARDARLFLNMLASNAGPNAALKAAAKRYKKSHG